MDYCLFYLSISIWFAFNFLKSRPGMCGVLLSLPEFWDILVSFTVIDLFLYFCVELFANSFDVWFSTCSPELYRPLLLIFYPFETFSFFFGCRSWASLFLTFLSCCFLSFFLSIFFLACSFSFKCFKYRKWIWMTLAAEWRVPMTAASDAFALNLQRYRATNSWMRRICSADFGDTCSCEYGPYSIWFFMIAGSAFLSFFFMFNYWGLDYSISTFV